MVTKPDIVHRLTVVVADKPEPGGSKNGFAIYKGSAKAGTKEFTGRVVIAETNQNIALWRKSVRLACRPNGVPLVYPPISGPTVVRFYFTLALPKSVTLKRRPFPSVKPDCTKLVRGTEDEFTQSGIWEDDARIVSTLISKAYVGGFHPDMTPALPHPGCVVHVYEIIT
jgi:Holliday junction resolvase RusA-like endonuclease